MGPASDLSELVNDATGYPSNGALDVWSVRNTEMMHLMGILYFMIAVGGSDEDLAEELGESLSDGTFME